MNNKLGLYSVFFLIITLSGCGQIEKHEPIDISCDKHVVLEESFQAILATIDGEPLKLKIHKVMDIPNVVVWQSMFNCKNGVFIYVTKERMKVGRPYILHLVFKNSSIKIKLDEGFNGMLPYGEDEILIRGTFVKRAAIDPALGDIEAFEIAPPVPEFPERSIIPAREHIYIENVIFNLKTKSIRKTVVGTGSIQHLQDGKFTTDTRDGRIIEFFPENGARKLLLDYQNLNIDPKDGIRKWFHSGAGSFYVDKNLFVVSGETPENLREDGEYFPSKTIFKYSSREGLKIVAKLDAAPLTGFLHDKKITSIGYGYASEYNTITNKIIQYKLPIENLELGVASKLNKNYILLGNRGEDAFVVVLSPDFKTILLDQKMEGFGGKYDISTSISPTSKRF